ncbi:MAG: DMT family transporter [Thermoanaerobaculaceae bacterium]
MVSKQGARPSVTTADWLLLVLIIIWGVNYTIIKKALEELHPLVFNALRFALATLILGIFLRGRGGPGKMSPKTALKAALLGILANTFYQLFFIEGLARTNVAHASLIQASMPSQVALLTHFTGRERMSRQGWIGIGLTFVGLTLLLSFRSTEGGQKPSWAGDALMFAAAFSWAVYTLLAEPVLTKAPASQVTLVGFLAGTPLLLLSALPQLFQHDLRHLSLATWGGVIFSGVLAIGLGYLVWNYAVRSLGTTRTAIYSNLTPVVAALVAWLALGERWRPLQIFGAATALFGVTLTRFARRSGRDDAGFDVFQGRRDNPPPDDLRAGRFSGGKRPGSF